MRSGNGIDLAAIYQLLSEVAHTVRGHADGFAAIDRKLGDMTADLTGLRDAVTHYHAIVLGHGVLISELR